MANRRLCLLGGQRYKKTIGCLCTSTNKYCQSCVTAGVNPFHSNSYCIYLYWFSRDILKQGFVELATTIYYLNKILNSVELFYEVELPPIWMCEHPLGSVIGRGKIGNYFFFAQGCTIGGNKGIYPTVGEKVSMLSNSKVIGNSHIGNNSIIAANTYIKDENIPDDSIVFGQSPDIIIKRNKSKKNRLWR